MYNYLVLQGEVKKNTLVKFNKLVFIMFVNLKIGIIYNVINRFNIFK